ncbi:MAG: hypothetical protein ACXVA9_00190 [Bdellovibrionales bacterium]
MEKISNIVRGNSRVASVDLKSAGAVRPGALTFGRPVGESPQVMDRGETTASKVTNLQNEMNEAKKQRSDDRVATQMADSFFMTRIRRPDDEIAAPAVPKTKLSAKASVETEAIDEISGEEQSGVEIAQPSGFVPRGSYVNVRG